MFICFEFLLFSGFFIRLQSNFAWDTRSLTTKLKNSQRTEYKGQHFIDLFNEIHYGCHLQTHCHLFRLHTFKEHTALTRFCLQRYYKSTTQSGYTREYALLLCAVLQYDITNIYYEKKKRLFYSLHVFHSNRNVESVEQLKTGEQTMKSYFSNITHIKMYKTEIIKISSKASTIEDTSKQINSTHFGVFIFIYLFWKHKKNQN